MLTVKNVKSFRGMEGYGFNASLYLNGKKTCFVIDEGNGGCYHFEWDGKDRAERDSNEKNVKSFIASLPPEKMKEDAEKWEKTLFVNGERPIDIESYVSGLVDTFENEKRLNKQKKTSVPFSTSENKNGQYFLMTHQGKVEETKAYILKKHPDAVFL